jgi:hypothetical protein
MERVASQVLLPSGLRCGGLPYNLIPAQSVGVLPFTRRPFCLISLGRTHQFAVFIFFPLQFYLYTLPADFGLVD